MTLFVWWFFTSKGRLLFSVVWFYWPEETNKTWVNCSLEGPLSLTLRNRKRAKTGLSYTLFHYIFEKVVSITILFSQVSADLSCSLLWISTYCHEWPRLICYEDDHLIFIFWCIEEEELFSSIDMTEEQSKPVLFHRISQRWQWFHPG